MHSMNVSYRRAHVAAFWFLLTVTVGLVIAAASAALGGSWTWGAAAVVLLLPRLLFAQWFDTGVWVWNGSTRVASALIRGYVVRVTHLMLFTAVGLAGSTLELAVPAVATSRWVDRKPADAAAMLTHARGWCSSLVESARLPRSRWLVVLIPVVWLLSLLDDGTNENAPPSSTSYTLY